MTRLLLIRHGETTWNAEQRMQGQTDTPLSDLGRAQARLLSARLRPEPLAAVYASDLSRALDTARPIAADHQLPLQTVPALREASFGDWEGLPIAEVKARWSEHVRLWWQDPHRYHVPNGETLEAVATRAAAALQRILAAHPEQTVAVVAHGGSLRAAMLTLLAFPLSGFRRLWLDNASVSILTCRKDFVRLLTLNETWHLNGQAGITADDANSSITLA